MSEADKLAENSVYIDTINSLYDLQIMFAKSLWEDYHGRLFLSPLKFKSALIVIKSYILYQFMSDKAEPCSIFIIIQILIWHHLNHVSNKCCAVELNETSFCTIEVIAWIYFFAKSKSIILHSIHSNKCPIIWQGLAINYVIF